MTQGILCESYNTAELLSSLH